MSRDKGKVAGLKGEMLRYMVEAVGVMEFITQDALLSGLAELYAHWRQMLDRGLNDPHGKATRHLASWMGESKPSSLLQRGLVIRKTNVRPYEWAALPHAEDWLIEGADPARLTGRRGGKVSLYQSRMAGLRRKCLPVLWPLSRVCAICGHEIDLKRGAVLDHVVPIDEQGEIVAHNMALAHGACNGYKATKHINEARAVVYDLWKSSPDDQTEPDLPAARKAERTYRTQRFDGIDPGWFVDEDQEDQ